MSQVETTDKLDPVEVLQLKLAATEEARCLAELRAARLSMEILHASIRSRHKMTQADSVDLAAEEIVRGPRPQNGAA